MKLLSWNVNGIRSVQRKGFEDWFSKQKADIICVQEIKAYPHQLEESLLHPLKYHSYWHPAQKAGYSGVAVYSRHEPLDVKYGMGLPEVDNEGRVLLLEYPLFSLINVYFPNTQRDHARLDYKLFFSEEFLKFCKAKVRSNLKQGRHLIVCGDYNVAHQEIDLKFPKANENNAGFLPAERAWMDRWIEQGFVDTFRHFVKDPGHYTWWSYRPGVRERNIGWRIDYFCVNQEFTDRLGEVVHQSDVMGSDHCPVVLRVRE